MTGARRLRAHGVRARCARAAAALAWCVALTLAPVVARGQARPAPLPDEFWWAAGAALAGAVAADDALARHSATHRSPALDRLASAGDALGTGRHLIVGMGTAYVGARLLRRPGLADAFAHAAAVYTAGNLVVSALKPAVGRHRPPGASDSRQFRPMSSEGAWHSFPSSHAIHAVTLAAALADESGSRRVAAVGYGAAALVAWSRVYDGQHWASDVVAAGVIGVVASRTTLRWLHGRAPHARPGKTPDGGGAARVRAFVLPGTAGITVTP